jgi:hypothetical protein
LFAVSELYEPFERLIEITILGRVFRVPENNLLLRQMQYVAPDIGSGRYCWNGECRYCEVDYLVGKGPKATALSCRVRGVPGMNVTKLALEVKYNMADALAAAEKAPAG